MTGKSGSPAPPAKRQRKWAPRSKGGCRTCKARRVKCDEKKPACGQCRRTGRQCPGYFLTSGRVMRSNPVAPIVPNAEYAPLSFQQPPLSPQLHGLSDVRDILDLMPRVNSAAIADSMQRSVRNSTEECLAHLPPRSGQSVALDAAVECVAVALRKLWLQHSAPQDSTHDRFDETSPLQLDRQDAEILVPYTHALRALQLALKDPNESTSSETMCAAALICYLEALHGQNLNGLLHHVIGIFQIIRYREVSSFQTDFDFTLLINVLPSIMKLCYWANRRCFLTQPKWLNVIQGVASNASGRQRATTDCFLNTAPIFNLMADCSKFILKQDTQKRSAIKDTQHEGLLAEITEQGQKFHAWHDSWLAERAHAKDNANDRKIRDIVTMPRLATLLHNRLYVALGGDDALQVEQQTQQLAQDLADMNDDSDLKRQNPIALGFAIKAILSTAEEWAQFSALERAEDGPRSLVSPDLFRRWLKQLRINVKI